MLCCDVARCDKDGDGTISINELLQFLREDEEYRDDAGLEFLEYYGVHVIKLKRTNSI